ncbi:hypothetical protein [Alkalihalobacillus sp. R86527]|uniref:hypothetical protein n=1 Tax=Alkalihalobacillus sp. R86527 TaxID=3093863 RepID=UPI0036735B55
MQEKFNVWSCVISFICILLFLTVAFSGWFTTSIMGIQPLGFVFMLSLLTFLAGVFGFSGIRGWKGVARSVSTIIITLGLSVFIGCALLFGSLLH